MFYLDNTIRPPEHVLLTYLVATTTTVNSEDHLDKPTVPQLGDMAHNPEITANTEKPDKNPSTGPARHTSPKAWVDLTTLEAKVQKEIQQLRVKINRLGTTRKVLSWWSNDETQLLGLCTSLKLPMKQTASVSSIPSPRIQEGLKLTVNSTSPAMISVAVVRDSQFCERRDKP